MLLSITNTYYPRQILTFYTNYDTILKASNLGAHGYTVSPLAKGGLMPLIRMFPNLNVTEQGPSTDTVKLKDGIRGIVAAALSCIVPDEAGEHFDKLDPDSDLELVTIPIGGEPGDHSQFGLLLDIEAYDYPDRVWNRNDRAETIRVQVEALIGELGYSTTVAVWLKTVAASWSSANE